MRGAIEGNEIWREPVRGGYPDPALLGLSGRDRLERWLRDRRLPPLTRLTGAVPTAFGDGTAEAEMPATDWLLNSAGVIGGGALAIVADIAFGCAVETRLPAATPYTTAELSLTLLRPARPGAVLGSHGQAIHVGRSVGLSEAFLLDPRGDELIAHGTSRLAILPRLERVPEGGAVAAQVEATADERPDPYLRDAPTDGVISQRIWDELPGREVLRRQLEDELPPPPIHWLTGLSLAAVGDGETTMRLPASQWLNSPAGLLQGGTIAMLADATMMSAALTTANPGTAIAGLDLKVNYLRPVPADGRDLTATGRVEHAGRRLAITGARLENGDGRPVALATSTAMYLPGRPANLGPEGELGENPAQ